MPEATTNSRDRARYATLARLAAETVTAVGDAIGVSDTAIVTRKRGRANFATAADHAAERTIVSRLTAHDRSVPILAEESAQKGLGASERLWVVDPIDGTLNFSRGLPFYCVVIGYVENGRARAAALHAPRTGETFVASEGAGLTCNGVPARVSDVARLAEAFAVTSLRFGETRKEGSRFALLNATCARLRVFGSAGLEIAYTAIGRLDLFVHEALSPWDIAGPALLAREGGAAVLSLKTGRDAAWNERQVVIANPALAKEAIKLLTKPRME
jgi:myo-inositol-1(or 4)-monophosphatase